MSVRLCFFPRRKDSVPVTSGDIPHQRKQDAMKPYRAFVMKIGSALSGHYAIFWTDVVLFSHMPPVSSERSSLHQRNGGPYSDRPRAMPYKMVLIQVKSYTHCE